MGLLKNASGRRSAQLNDADFPVRKVKNTKPESFHQWAAKYGFSQCGLFMPVHGMMVIKHAFNIDAKTVAASVSSKEFWKKNITDSGWTSYSRTTSGFSAFAQFFPKDKRDVIQTVHCMKIESGNDTYVLFSFDYIKSMPPRQTEFFLPELIDAVESRSLYSLELADRALMEKVILKNDARLYFISVKSAINKAMENIEIPEYGIKKALQNTVYEQLYSKTKASLSFPNLTASDSTDEIKISLCIKENLDDSLIRTHFEQIYTGILGKEAAESIYLISSGKKNTIQEIEDFLMQG